MVCNEQRKKLTNKISLKYHKYKGFLNVEDRDYIGFSFEEFKEDKAAYLYFSVQNENESAKIDRVIRAFQYVTNFICNRK